MYFLLFEVREALRKASSWRELKIIIDKSNSVAMFLQIQTDLSLSLSIYICKYSYIYEKSGAMLFDPGWLTF